MSKACSHKLCILFLSSFFLTVLFFFAVSHIFVKSFKDPRWRIFDYNSRQASVSDIYNVAEIPAIKSVTFAGERTLRFEFTPKIETSSWTIRSESDGSVVHEGCYPDIPFPDEPCSDTFVFIPAGVDLARDITVRISFYPKERYAEAGLSWPDNYYSPASSVPFSLKEPRSLDEWAGLPDDDPDVVEARRILGNTIELSAPPLDRSAQIFAFVMNSIRDSGGTPTDEVQDASPLETYRLLSTGAGKGWCENRALVYYLFANAVGIKTRLVDLAGKFGPLKLTGHYFCESWDPGLCRWFLVDPMSGVAQVRKADGRLLNSVEIKHLFDLDAFDGCSVLAFDSESGGLVEKDISAYYRGNKGYFTGDVVLAFKSGYPRNKTYSKLKHFFRYPTLLYAPFSLPGLYAVRQWCLVGLIVSGAVFAVTGIIVFVTRLKPVKRIRGK